MASDESGRGVRILHRFRRLPKRAFALMAVAIIAIAGSTYLYLYESDKEFVIPFKMVDLVNENLFEVNVSFYLDGVPLPFCTNYSGLPHTKDFSCASHVSVTVPRSTEEIHYGHVGGLLVPQDGQAWTKESVIRITSDLYEDDYEFSTNNTYQFDWTVYLEPTGWEVDFTLTFLF